MNVERWQLMARFASVLTLTLFLVVMTSAQGLRIEAGPVASFDIALASAVRAGDRVDLRLTARDAAGNIVVKYAEQGGGVTLTSVPSTSGASGIDPNRFPASAFRDGVLATGVVLTRAGVMELEVQDLASRVRSRSERVDVRPGAVFSVKVTGPREARVGEPFDVTIELSDRFGNPLTDYDRVGAEIVLGQGVSGGVGVFEPSRLSPSLFTQGRATIRVRYSQSENVAIVANAGDVRGRSAGFTVHAGALHAFKVTAPARQVPAGEPFSVAIEAVDALGNTIIDYDRTGMVVTLKTTGLGQLEPSTVPPTAFQQGIALVNVRYTQAEKVGIVAQDPSGAKRGESVDRVDVVGGRLGRFEIIPAENARAGAPLAVQIVGYDIYGNLVKNYAGRTMRLVLNAADAAPQGSATPQASMTSIQTPNLSASSFIDGFALVSVTPVKAGPLVVQVVDEYSGAGGRSAAVRVRPGVVASYGVRAPETVSAHEPFEVELTAVDRFGNVIDDYDRTGDGLVVSASGLGSVAPAAIAASAFQSGVARVKFTATTAEEIVLSISQQGGTARGRSTPVLVTHAEARRFKVVAPARVVAGEPAHITLTVLDDYDNPVVAYGGMNRNLSLYTENGDPVAPPLISATAFRRGVAEVDAIFFHTGDAMVVVEEVGGSVTGKSGAVRVISGAPAQLVVNAATQAEAGTPLSLRVEMRDKMGNRIRDYSPAAASLSINVHGASGALTQSVALGEIRNMIFREGVAEVSVLPQKVETVQVEVTDEVLGVKGRSPSIAIAAGPVDRFTVDDMTGGVLMAGSPMKLRITALDAYGNVVTAYGQDGAGVRLLPRTSAVAADRAPASGVFVPSNLKGDLFINGRAEVYALYDRAERVEIGVERLAAGLLSRPEVSAASASERSGGAVISILGNASLVHGEASRLGDALFELVIPGAMLSANSLRVTRPAGIVSLITLAQEDDGVRILIHTAAPAVLRAGDDGNRIVIDVDPVLSAGNFRSPVLVPTPFSPATEPSSAVSGVSAPLPTMADIDRLVRENRFQEALALVNIMISAHPTDAAILGLRRRLETLAGLSSGQVAPPQPIVNPSPSVDGGIPRTSPDEPALQPLPQLSGMAAAEAAVRAGRYHEAIDILTRVIADNPADTAAIRMKQRIEQMMRIIEEQSPNNGR